MKREVRKADPSASASQTAHTGSIPGVIDRRHTTLQQYKLADAVSSSRQVATQLALNERIGVRPALRAPVPGASRIAQRESIDLGPHGKATIPDHLGLTADKPTYGGKQTVLGNKVASSMDVLLTPNHPQGSSPKELDALFDKLPTKGSYDLPGNIAKKGTRTGDRLYIKGHLLNDNLGGPGTAENLFPITHQANVDHNNLVEETIKDRVNDKGEVMRYKVVATFSSSGDTDLVDSGSVPLKFVNGDFLCTTTEYPLNAAPVTKTKRIYSKWNEVQGNAGNLALNDTYTAASTLDKEKVKIMPRAKVKAEWDKTHLLIAKSLADSTGIALEKWMTALKIGIGPKGAKLIESGVDYNTLQKADKRTLTNAREHLKKYIEDYYSHYKTVEAGYDDTTVADEDKDPQAEQEVAEIEKQYTTIDVALKELESFQDSYEGIDTILRKKYAVGMNARLFNIVSDVDPAQWHTDLVNLFGAIKLGAAKDAEEVGITSKTYVVDIATELINILLRQWEAQTESRILGQHKFDVFCRLARQINDGTVAPYPLTYTIKAAKVWLDSGDEITLPERTIVMFDKNAGDKFLESKGLGGTSLYFEVVILDGEFTDYLGKISKDAVAHTLL